MAFKLKVAAGFPKGEVRKETPWLQWEGKRSPHCLAGGNVTAFLEVVNLVVVLWSWRQTRSICIVPIQRLSGIGDVLHLGAITALVDVLVQVLHSINAAAHLHVDVGVVLQQQRPVVGHHPSIVDAEAVGQVVHTIIATPVLRIAVLLVQSGLAEGLGVPLGTLPVLHAGAVHVQRPAWAMDHEP